MWIKYHKGPITTEWTSVPSRDSGVVIRASIDAGAATALKDDAWWGPTMIDSAIGEPYFALWDRAWPHPIWVDCASDRFMNKSESHVDAIHHPDEHGCVLGENGKVILGLYGYGNTTASVMGRRHPGAGSTLGPAITFSSLAVDRMAGSN